MNTKSAAEILSEEYPQLYTNVRCGVSIGIGWVHIIRTLSDAVLARGSSVVVEQVKEKFGILRYYYSGDDIDDLVGAAEFASITTCEECGEVGTWTLSRSGCLRTLCVECKS